MEEFRSLMYRLANTLAFDMDEETVVLYMRELRHIPNSDVNQALKKMLVDPPFHFPSIQEIGRRSER